MAKNIAVKFVLYMALVALSLQTAHGVSYVVGNQLSGYTGMFIGQYNQWLVGSPRTVSYMGASIDPNTDLGAICAGPWNSWAVIGNSAPGNFDFNCVGSADEISANVGTVGFYVGGLNLNGVTVAQCYVAPQTSNLCDSDTVSDSGSLQCTTYLECQ